MSVNIINVLTYESSDLVSKLKEGIPNKAPLQHPQQNTTSENTDTTHATRDAKVTRYIKHDI